MHSTTHVRRAHKERRKNLDISDTAEEISQPRRICHDKRPNHNLPIWCEGTLPPLANARVLVPIWNCQGTSRLIRSLVGPEDGEDDEEDDLSLPPDSDEDAGGVGDAQERLVAGVRGCDNKYRDGSP